MILLLRYISIYSSFYQGALASDAPLQMFL